MVERLIAKLAYSPLFRRLFSTLPRLAAKSDPEVQRRILDRAEQSVYGKAGMTSYERGGASELQRAARRSLAQHLCQRSLRGSRLVNAIRDGLGALVLTPLVALFAVASIRSGRMAESPGPDLVIFFWYERLYKFVEAKAFPGQTTVLHRGRQICFSARELKFLLRAIAACPRLLCFPVLLCNLVRWLGYYGFAADFYRPKHAVVHFCESVASSSLLTAYLHERGLRHIDVQHGELRFMTNFAFCHFDEIRVWGDYFREIVLLNRSPREDVRVVQIPYYRELFMQVRNRLQPRPARLLILDPFLYHDLARYASLIDRVLVRLDASWEIRVRRHPAELRKKLDWMELVNANPSLRRRGIAMTEEGPSVPIEAALARSRLVLGVASGAMIEAWIAGCKVIHLAGGPCRSELMGRYQGSENVLYLDEACSESALDRFLLEPVRLHERESQRINHLVEVKGAAA